MCYHSQKPDFLNQFCLAEYNVTYSYCFKSPFPPWLNGPIRGHPNITKAKEDPFHNATSRTISAEQIGGFFFYTVMSRKATNDHDYRTLIKYNCLNHPVTSRIGRQRIISYVESYRNQRNCVLQEQISLSVLAGGLHKRPSENSATVPCYFRILR